MRGISQVAFCGIPRRIDGIPMSIYETPKCISGTPGSTVGKSRSIYEKASGVLSNTKKRPLNTKSPFVEYLEALVGYSIRCVTGDSTDDAAMYLG